MAPSTSGEDLGLGEVLWCDSLTGEEGDGEELQDGVGEGCLGLWAFTDMLQTYTIKNMV